MSSFDYFIGGKWRNRKPVEHVLKSVRAAGKTAYCFIENAYDGHSINIDTSPNSDVEEFMSNLEAIRDWQTNPTFRQIFESDLNGIRNSKEALFVFPAGDSVHMELGVAYGMGKKCYGIGLPSKSETLYLMIDEFFPTVEEFLK